MKASLLSKEQKEVLLDLHLLNKPVPPVMRAELFKQKLITKTNDITHAGVAAVHAYAQEKNRRAWIDK